MPRRTGFTLMELLAVVTLMGVFASAVVIRFGRDTLDDTGARSSARILSVGLHDAQRAAIRTGDTHGVRFRGPVTDISHWEIIRRDDDGTETIIDGPFPISKHVTMQTSSPWIWFDFEGNTTQGWQSVFLGPNRRYRVSVLHLTQMILTEDVTP